MFKELLHSVQTILCSTRGSDFPTYDQEIDFCKKMGMNNKEMQGFILMLPTEKTQHLSKIEKDIFSIQKNIGHRKIFGINEEGDTIIYIVNENNDILWKTNDDKINTQKMIYEEIPTEKFIHMTMELWKKRIA